MRVNLTVSRVTPVANSSNHRATPEPVNDFETPTTDIYWLT